MSEPLELVLPKPVIDAQAIQTVEEVLAGMKAGRVSALVIVAKENGFARWSSVRAYVQSDRYNLIGQLTAVIQQLVEMTEKE